MPTSTSPRREPHHQAVVPLLDDFSPFSNNGPPTSVVNDQDIFVPNAFDSLLNTGETLQGQEQTDFDFLFDPEGLQRAGLSYGDENNLPLSVLRSHIGGNVDADSTRFLDDHSLGTSFAPTDHVPFVGLEDYFLPAELDDLLATLGHESAPDVQSSTQAH
jgi:hypothetical protein